MKVACQIFLSSAIIETFTLIEWDMFKGSQTFFKCTPGTGHVISTKLRVVEFSRMNFFCA